MYRNQLSRVSFSTISMLLCAAVISSCGSSKESKKSAETTVQQVPLDGAPQTSNPTDSNPQTGGAPAPTTVGNDNPAPVGSGTNTGGEPIDNGNGNSNGSAAPIGHVSEDSNQNDNSSGSSQVAKNAAPDFSEKSVIKTGGQTGDLYFTSASDDGIMDHFRAISTGVSKEQQTMNANLAKAITGAKLKKSGSDYSLDVAMDEFGKVQLYRMKASVDGSKMKLSSISSTGGLEFQGGFVKCLEASCNNAYAKVKFSGAYTRIIFRTQDMNNQFLIQTGIQDNGFDMWRSYIENTVQGVASTAQIQSVISSSYEVLNGKAAMGVQLLTRDNEAAVFNLLLVAPESGTALNQSVTRVTDLSMNYNLAPTTGKATTLSSQINQTSLVNNNGKGQIKLKLSFNMGSIWMVLFKVKTTTMTAAEVQAFEKTVPNF